MSYIFYCKESNNVNRTNINLNKDYSFKIWTPTIYQIVPKELFEKPFFLWWTFYFPKLFTNSGYRIFMVYYGNKMVHYTIISSKCFKFPFMERNDLQIGPSGTHIEHRRKGIASYVIQKILELYKKENRKFWWIVREENIISIHTIEKVGFMKYGKGIRRKKIGIGIFIIDAT